MGKSLKETICEISKKHLEENNGLLLGQCLKAVGWVNGTIPDSKNIVELPMCDVAGVGIAVGIAIANRRPILVIRYQDFITLGWSTIINYAAKTKDMFGRGTPIFVRLIADEGKGLGPVHSGKLHSLFMHFPGLKVCAPIAPNEYQNCWDNFMAHDDPMIVSEHRGSYYVDYPIGNIFYGKADITLIGISVARLNIELARNLLLKQQGIKCNILNIVDLKPFDGKRYAELLFTKKAIVVDTGFETCGAAESIACQLMLKTNSKIFPMGLEDKSVGCSQETENLTPSADKIVLRVGEILNA